MLLEGTRRIQNIIAVLTAVVMMLLGVAIISGSAAPVYGADAALTDYPNYVDRQLVVVFDDDVDKTTAANIVAFALSEELINEQRAASSSMRTIKDNLRITKIKTHNNMMLINCNVNLDEEAAAKEIAKNPDVVSAQPNYFYTAAAGTAVGITEGDGDWYLDYIDAEEARNLMEKKEASGRSTETAQDAKAAGSKVVVACLDTEVQKGHESLKDVAVVSTNNDDDVADGHGTEMAGLIAKTAGKDKVKILAIDVFNERSNYAQKSVATTTGIIAGIDYACKHDAQIVTMAFGRHGQDAALKEKTDWAADKDVLLIAAAGDNGDDAAWYPSDYEHCLSCINSVKYTDAFGKACKNGDASYGKAKALSAPGTEISVPDINGGFANKTGSTYSAAIVAGTAAMVMRANPDITAAKAEEILLETASDLGGPGQDIYTGHGNVNAYKAVANAYGVKALLNTQKRPGKVHAKAQAGEEGITISWNAVKGADTYLVYRKGQSNDIYRLKAQVPKGETSWTDKNCKAGKKYSYKVAAGTTTKDGKKLIGKSGSAARARALK